MNKKLKYLNEINLDSSSKRKVKRWLNNWIDEFIKRADNSTYQVELCNFKENELFFFTKCQDILKDDPEETGNETNFQIRKRKRQIVLALFLKEMLGEKIKKWDRKCSHCGNTNMIIKTVGDSSYYRYCPDCKRFVIDTYESDIHRASYNLLKQYVPDVLKNE